MPFTEPGANLTQEGSAWISQTTANLQTHVCEKKNCKFVVGSLWDSEFLFVFFWVFLLRGIIAAGAG